MTLGTDASLAAGPVGRTGSAAMTLSSRRDLSYSAHGDCSRASTCQVASCVPIPTPSELYGRPVIDARF